MNTYPKLTEVKALDNYNLFLLFSNGEEKIFDFTENLNHPFYKNLKDKALFYKCSVNDGEIEWATGQDFCPHTLYEKGRSYTEYAFSLNEGNFSKISKQKFSELSN